MKIVSLLGSATEILFELGLERHLVGISHECDFPPEALDRPRLSRPRFNPDALSSGEIDAAVRRSMEEFGSVYEVDRDLLRQLEPDVVLTQAVCEVCAVPTGSVEAAVAELRSSATVVSLDAHTIDGIFATMYQVAEAAQAPRAGDAAIRRLRRRLARVEERIANQHRPRTLLLEWLDPPFAPGHWVPEMVTLAGGENLIGAAGSRSEQIGWGELAGLEPDILLIEPCGYDLETGSGDATSHRERLSAVASAAIAKQQAWVLHSAWFSRSGPRVVEGVETLARVLHPSAFDEWPNPMIARPWR